ncbi:response regulator, partial [Paraburkholderia terricola]|uniref:response regulator n=1 Tax=Paraburkholderia terricola TaxID=169427 RepID=UPI0035B50B84
SSSSRFLCRHYRRLRPRAFHLSGCPNLRGHLCPDLLLTDWDMPGIDGPELCRIFRNDPVLASVPIILASSLSLPPAGAPDLHNLFLQKPVDALALLAAVSALAVVVVATDTSQADGRLDEELPGDQQ